MTERRHSHGTVTWVDGERYEGDWRAGNQHGLGTYTWADGRAKTCEWRDSRERRREPASFTSF